MQYKINILKNTISLPHFILFTVVSSNWNTLLNHVYYFLGFQAQYQKKIKHLSCPYHLMSKFVFMYHPCMLQLTMTYETHKIYMQHVWGFFVFRVILFYMSQSDKNIYKCFTGFKIWLSKSLQIISTEPVKLKFKIKIGNKNKAFKLKLTILPHKKSKYIVHASN